MIDEVLYMQMRVFRMFCNRSGLDPREANRLFIRAGAWKFIADCFDSLHVDGDELVYDDLMRLFRHQGVAA